MIKENDEMFTKAPREPLEEGIDFLRDVQRRLGSWPVAIIKYFYVLCKQLDSFFTLTLLMGSSRGPLAGKDSQASLPDASDLPCNSYFRKSLGKPQ